MAASAEKTVAVLPFRNAGAPEDDYLAEELTDDLIDALSMTRGLKVRARGAVQRFRGEDRDPRDIGREIGVQVVVEGSVRRARGHVRISARLVSVADGFQIWAKRFDRPEQDVLSINDEAARAIAEALTLDRRLLDERAREAPSDPVAVDLYLRARHEYRKFWPEARGALDHALRAGALARAGRSARPLRPRARPRAPRLLRRRRHRARQGAWPSAPSPPPPSSARRTSRTARCSSSSARCPPPRAPCGSRCAQSPGLAEAHGVLGRLLSEAGAHEEGLRRLETAISLDPETALMLPDLARLYALLGRWDRMEEIADRLQKGAPVYWTLRARMALWRRDRDVAETFLAQLPNDDLTMRLPRLFLEVVRTGRVPPALLDIEKMELGAGGTPAADVHAPAPRRGLRLRRRPGGGRRLDPRRRRARAHRPLLARALPAPRARARRTRATRPCTPWCRGARTRSSTRIALRERGYSRAEPRASLDSARQERRGRSRDARELRSRVTT